MAIKYIPYYSKYTALSTDDLSTIDVNNGTRVYFTDTYQSMIYDSSVGWKPDILNGDRTGALTMIDSRHRTIHNGNAYGIDFTYVDGITNGVTDYFWGVNTSETKNIYFNPVFFNNSTLIIYYVIGGSYTKNSVAYTPDESSSLIIPSHNLDIGSTNESSFIIYNQGSGVYPFENNEGTDWVWNDDIPTGTWITSEYGGPSIDIDVQYILRPGQKVMGSISNTGSSKVSCSVKMFWFEE